MSGDWRGASVSYPGLPDVVKPGETILIGDGAIDLVVESVTPNRVETRVRIGGLLSAHKGVNIPGRTLAMEALTPKDREDAVFAVEQEIDWLAVSFVRNPEELRVVRRWVASRGGHIPLIAKIEKREALDNLDGILAESDGVMVARGDLGVEIPFEEVPFIQKEIITHALARDIPVITATHMLESMITQPRPTRAEATDIATAVLDGTDAVMLSEETAAGRYPVEAVRTMARIAERAERNLDHGRFMHLVRQDHGVTHAVAQAACTLAAEVGAGVILVPTASGRTPLRVASRRPAQAVVALPHDPAVRSRLALAWGITAVSIPITTTADEMIRVSVETAHTGGCLKSGDLAVITGGVPLQQPGTTNFIQVVRVT